MNLSYSSRLLINSCPRKFYLRKVANIQDSHDEDNPDLAFGKALEAAVVEYLRSKDLKRASVAALQAWSIDLDLEWKEKNFWNVLLLTKKFPYDDFLNSKEFKLLDYQVGYKIDLGDGFADRGWIDAILYSEERNLYTILEVKTTGSRNINPLSYKNSSQAEGYATVLDLILKKTGKGEANLNVIYLVAQVPQLELHVFPFPKGQHIKKEFLATLLLEKERVQRYKELEFWPRHGQSCMSYNRECTYANVCGFNLGHFEQKVEEVEADNTYDFDFHINDFITSE